MAMRVNEPGKKKKRKKRKGRVEDPLSFAVWREDYTRMEGGEGADYTQGDFSFVMQLLNCVLEGDLRFRSLVFVNIIGAKFDSVLRSAIWRRAVKSSPTFNKIDKMPLLQSSVTAL